VVRRLIGKTEVGADIRGGVMKYFLVWRHDDVRRERAVSGYARCKAAHTAEWRKLLNDISAVVEIHVT